MKISREDVLKVAALANLELTDAEVDVASTRGDEVPPAIGLAEVMGFEDDRLGFVRPRCHSQ